jgi:hypothetical protein
MLRRLAEIFLDHWHENRDFVSAYAQKAGGGLSIQTLRDGANPPMFELLVAMIERQQGPGGRAAHRAPLVAHGLLALWLRLGMQYLFGPNVDRSELIGVLVDMTYGAIKGIKS